MQLGQIKPKKINIEPGAKFGKWTVIGESGRNKWGLRLVKCKCDCGNIKELLPYTIYSKHSTQCRSCSSKINIEPGTKYGKWVVLEEAGRNKSGFTLFKCKCDCGNIKQIRGSNIIYGRSKKCKGKHDKPPINKHYLYGIWHNIKYNVYCNKLYQPWRNDFIAFKDYVLSTIGERPGPSNQYCLDRIRINKGYIPGNIRWATRKESINNRNSQLRRVL